MPFPEAILLDDFNRADEGPPPSGWAESYSDDQGAIKGWKISGNAAVATTPGNGLLEYCHWPAIYSNDLDIHLDIAVASTGGENCEIGFHITNPTSASFSGYNVVLDATGGELYRLRCYRFDNGVATQLGSTISRIGFTPLRFGVRRAGSNILIYTDEGSGWVERGSVSDGTYNAGYVRIGIGGAYKIDNVYTSPLHKLHILEALVMTDLLQRGGGKNVIESIALNDLRMAALFKELMDLLLAGEERLSFISKNAVESVGFSDERALAFNVALADMIATVDALAKSAGKEAAEQLALTDQLQRGVAAVFAELLALADDLAKTTARDLGETLTLDDVVTGQLNADATNHVKTLAESLALVDSMNRTAAILLQDILAAGDVLVKSGTLTLSDAAALADFLVKSPALTKAEQLIVSDEAAKLYGLNEEETLALDDLLAKQTSFTIEDVMAVADSLTAQFIQLFGIVRFLHAVLRISSVGSLLIETSKADMVAVRSSAVHTLRMWSRPAIAIVAVGQSSLTGIVVLS